MTGRTRDGYRKGWLLSLWSVMERTWMSNVVRQSRPPWGRHLLVDCTHRTSLSSFVLICKVGL